MEKRKIALADYFRICTIADKRPQTSSFNQYNPASKSGTCFSSCIFCICKQAQSNNCREWIVSLISTGSLRLPQLRAQIQPTTIGTMTPQSPSHQSSFEARLDARFNPRPISSRFVTLHLYCVPQFLMIISRIKRQVNDPSGAPAHNIVLRALPQSIPTISVYISQQI